MTALVLAMLLTQAAPAPAADAPVLELPPQGKTIEVKAGELVPFDGVCLDAAQSLRAGKRVAACEAGLKVAESKSMISTPVLVAGVAGVVAAVGAAFAAGYLAGKNLK